MLLHSANDARFQDELVKTIKESIERKKNELWENPLTFEESRTHAGYIRAMHDVMAWMDAINQEHRDGVSDRKANR